jgi:hypothetical protein
MIEAIYWKPEVSTIVEEVAVLRPIRTMTLRFNEVDRMPGKDGLLIDGSARTQTTYVCVRSPAYRIKFRYFCFDNNPGSMRRSSSGGWRRGKRGATFAWVAKGSGLKLAR